MNKNSWRCLFFCAALFFSCGIEDYVYLAPVEYTSLTGSTSARVTIPDNYTDPDYFRYFRYYAIFYRIYISDVSTDSITTSEQRYAINHALASHYNAIDPYTVNDNISPSSVGTIFSSLKYYPLYAEVASGNIVSMSRILQHPNTAGVTPPGSPIISPSIYPVFSGNIAEAVFALSGPYLKINYNAAGTLNSGELSLYRASGADGFVAHPDRSFFNSTGSSSLTDETIISENINADVEKNPGMTFSTRYAYVSLYIAASGIDNNFTAVYSRPKHIGIFRLPTP
ncbi:MAG: hypothetical protein LBI67_12275 [Treponema sp.]|nr:hypothetical protein [Treponema sp.]